MLIKKISKLQEEHIVYNIAVKNNNNYFANGMLVHNCFAYYFRSGNPSMQNEENSRKLKSIDYDKFEKVLTGKMPEHKQWKYFFSKRYILQWGSMGDPFCNFEQKNRIGEKLLRLFGDINYPVKICFKGNTIKDYIHLFDKYKFQKNFVIQSSVINTDDNLSKVIEMGAATPTERLEYLHTFSDMGYLTILRLRPFMIGMSDVTLDDLLYKVKKYGINAISTEFFCLDVRVSDGIRNRYKWMSKMLGYDIEKYYRRLSPTSRGGYRRLNRDVKERYIRKMYKFCIDNNVLFACSDPDFKELNMSGSCCGLPDVFPGNPEITNFVRCQATNALRLLRKDYWAGNKRTLTFKEVYSDLDPVFSPYFDEESFYGDSVAEIGKSAGQRAGCTLGKDVKTGWNNLRSPKNPVNYFNNKIKPILERDFEGNLIFEYNPSPYEYMWKDLYGIDLSKF